MTYPGGKNSNGAYQRIISLMPPHEEYIEPFLGSGAVLRHKLPAPARNVGIDADAGAVESLASHFGSDPRYVILHRCGVEWMNARTRGHNWHGKELVYCDPPYLLSTRRGQRPIYRCELATEDRHRLLLDCIKRIEAMVIISGYPSSLYDKALAKWSCVSFLGWTRVGRAEERLWFNFPAPSQLHDYRFLGEDFHDRLRIQRKIRRLIAKVSALPMIERAAVIAALNDAAPTSH